MPLLTSLRCLLASTLIPFAAQAGGKSANTSVPGQVPLNELGSALYLGFPGGLYPDAANTMPGAHHNAGLSRAAALQPRDALGNPSPDGKIGILTMGMSNAQQVFGLLGTIMEGLWAAPVVFVNGALASQDASIWGDEGHPTHNVPWDHAAAQVAAAGLTAAQIQVALNMHAVAHRNVPPLDFPATPRDDLLVFQRTIAA